MRKTIITTLFVIALLTLWSLSNDNKDTNITTVAVPVEIIPVTEVELVAPVKLAEVIINIEPKTLKEQIRCMAHNIYHEAGGEPYIGQVAVARVVMNRVKHGFADTPCKVIYQTTKRYDPNNERDIVFCQFSWVCQGKKSPDPHSNTYKTAEEIAELVIRENRWHDAFEHDLLFFHNHTVKPGWGYPHRVTIGNHIFYAKAKPETK